jgi:hypothetical protein
MSTSEPGRPDPGVPYGSGPEGAAADAEPTLAHEAVAPPKSPSGDTTPPPGAPAGEAAPPPVPPAPAAAGGDGPPLAIPGIPLDRPELHVAAAFAGGFVLAMVLKRLAR